jgi:hypothetical protein
MAEMIPDMPTSDAPQAERVVYRALKEGLPDGYRVFHSLPFLQETQNGLREGEADFVVTHPTRGLLVIEVKGGAQIAYEGGAQSWTSTDHGGTRHSIRDPYQQAQRSMHALIDKIVDVEVVRRKGAIPFPYGYAVWFPGAGVIDGTLPSHANRTLTITRARHDAVQQAIEQALGAWRGYKRQSTSDAPRHGSASQDISASPDVSASVMERVIERVLQPEFRVVRTLRTQLKETGKTYARLTEEQADTFSGVLQANRRALVKGFAGSGKTFLAVRRAVELARSGADTLFLCYNRHLADHLERQMAEEPNIKVATFHELADEWARYVPGRTFPTNPDQEFWETGAADLLTEAIDEAGICYDAILVDEAQDFRETWWVPVELMLRESSHFYVFLDPGQDIFGTDVKGLMDLPTTVPLAKNCRSTRQISRFASRLAGRDEPPAPAHVTGGAGVRTVTFSKRTEQIPMLEDIVRDLKQNQGLRSEDLILLSPHSYANCILADAEYRVAGYEVKPFELTPPGEGTVYYESIHRFKGMEAPVVVLFDVRDGHVASSNANIYVGCTRARDVLYVIHEEGWSP